MGPGGRGGPSTHCPALVLAMQPGDQGPRWGPQKWLQQEQMEAGGGRGSWDRGGLWSPAQLLGLLQVRSGARRQQPATEQRRPQPRTTGHRKCASPWWGAATRPCRVLLLEMGPYAPQRRQRILSSKQPSQPQPQVSSPPRGGHRAHTNWVGTATGKPAQASARSLLMEKGPYFLIEAGESTLILGQSSALTDGPRAAWVRALPHPASLTLSKPQGQPTAEPAQGRHRFLSPPAPWPRPREPGWWGRLASLASLTWPRESPGRHGGGFSSQRALQRELGWQCPAGPQGCGETPPAQGPHLPRSTPAGPCTHQAQEARPGGRHPGGAAGLSPHCLAPGDFSAAHKQSKLGIKTSRDPSHPQAVFQTCRTPRP